MFRIVSAQTLLVVIPQTRLKSLARGWKGERGVLSGIELFVPPSCRSPGGCWVPLLPNPIPDPPTSPPHTNVRPLQCTGSGSAAVQNNCRLSKRLKKGFKRMGIRVVSFMWVLRHFFAFPFFGCNSSNAPMLFVGQIWYPDECQQ